MQWMTLSGTSLCLNDDYETLNLGSMEKCKEGCMFWSNGPCKSFSWQDYSSTDIYFRPWCCLSRTDQHSNREDMINSIGDYVENCEGKTTLSQAFDQENNYIKSGKSPLNIREF